MPYTYNVKIDFYNDWIRILKNELTNMGYEPSTKKEDVCFQYFNLKRRMVTPKPRKVRISKEFSCPKELESGLELLKKRIENGLVLKPHLSRFIYDLDYHDDLLNDWGIHHLHLGTKFIDSNLVQRTGPLLFVRFDDEYAYFIDVMRHGSWTKQKMIRIIHKNWPESINQFIIKGFSKVNHLPTDNDIKKLRKARANTFIQVDEGVIYAPIGMGFATSGHSVDVVRTCDFYVKRIRDYEKYVRENHIKLINEANKVGVKIGENAYFHLGIEGNEVYALEVFSRVFFKLGPLS